MSESDEIDALLDEELPPEPPVRKGPKQVPGPNDGGSTEPWDVPPNYEVWTHQTAKGEQVKEPYRPGMRLAEGQRPQPPLGALLPYEGPLPPDIEEVWGGGRVDDTGLPAENTARMLIGAKGLPRFRASGQHSLAVQEHGREQKMDPIRKAFIEAYRKKQA